MKLIAQVKLNPTKEQAQLLKQTIETANACCDAISQLAFESQTFGQYAIHQAYYSQIRVHWPLSAQIVVRAIAKVADAYKLDKKVQRRFKPLGAIAYDDRILTWQTQSKSLTSGLLMVAQRFLTFAVNAKNNCSNTVRANRI